MVLSRSKSAPQVTGPTSSISSLHLTETSHTSSARHPKILRHASTPAIAGSSVNKIAASGGYQTPRVEREDDPFSLTGFFPASCRGLFDRTVHIEWDWLHYEVEESDIVGAGRISAPTVTVASSGYTSPMSEDGEWALPPTPPQKPPMFDRGEDEVRGETIRREDKLGILSLPNPFVISKNSSEAGSFVPALLSPYTEDDPLDSDALHNVLCALRNTHTASESAAGVHRVSSGGLFSSREEGVVDSDLETLGTRGLGRLLDMFSF